MDYPATNFHHLIPRVVPDVGNNIIAELTENWWRMKSKPVLYERKSYNLAGHSRKAALPGLGHWNHECFIPGAELYAYLHATGVLYGIAGCRERISGDRASFKSFSPLLCYLAQQDEPATTVVFLQRRGIACKWVLLSLTRASNCSQQLRTRTALLRAGPESGSLIHPSSSKEKWIQHLVLLSSEALTAPPCLGW